MGVIGSARYPAVKGRLVWLQFEVRQYAKGVAFRAAYSPTRAVFRPQAKMEWSALKGKTIASWVKVSEVPAIQWFQLDECDSGFLDPNLKRNHQQQTHRGLGTVVYAQGMHLVRRASPAILCRSRPE